ncbi:cation:proton antiporter [Derxia gummosa]|uniref:Cation:proton antiporter n=1 Tax=Derxia gummosa DSM 723 TaxID=1121388 RepID=A0A8B6X1V3_9BURK|nr:cation:proton antiporter [Derxia gummosa]
MHNLTIIATLAGALAVALVFGWITRRAGLSTLVGYMLAGIVVGPYTPGFVADAELASQMSEIGVILLMFGVGLHFHPGELLQVRRIAIPGAVAQSVVATLAGWAVARLCGWSSGGALVFGMALAVASTVVLMRMLVERDRLGTHAGHVAVGWLIVEDLFTVIALVVLPALAAEDSTPFRLAGDLALAFGKAGLFAALVWLLGTKLVGRGLERIARAQAGELFTLAVFVVALGVALIAAEVFHVSVALGAFLAGLAIGQSRIGPRAADDMSGFRDVFSALFFVSVGMLFNPRVIIEAPVLAIAALVVVLVVKPLVALGIVHMLKGSARTGRLVAVGLAQIGEFSFILAALGRQEGMLPDQGFDVLVLAAIVSIGINPLLFRWEAGWEARRSRAVDTTEDDDAPGAARDDAGVAAPSSALLPAGASAPHPATIEGDAVLLVGLGALGRRVAQRCADLGVPLGVVGEDSDALEPLRRRGLRAVLGDPLHAGVLDAAGIAKARLFVVADGTLDAKMALCLHARRLNPRLAIVVAAHSDAERAWLAEFGGTHVCDAIDELGEAMLRTMRAAL